jgi:hypothetical protein
MSGIWVAWGIAVFFSAWNNGVKKAQFPPPYVFLDPTLLFGGIALLARWQPRIAGLLAFGLVLPVILLEVRTQGNPLYTMANKLAQNQPVTPVGGRVASQFPSIQSLQFEAPINPGPYPQQPANVPIQGVGTYNFGINPNRGLY